MQPMKYVDEFLTEEEVNRLVSFAETERDRVLVLFLFYSVRRVSEVVRSLKAGDVSRKTDNIEYTILKKVKKCAVCGKRTRYFADEGVWKCIQPYKTWMLIEGHEPSVKPVRVWIREGPFFKGMFDTYAMLRKYIEDNHIAADEYVFPICRSTVDLMIKEMAHKAGVTFTHRQMHAHVLRHSGSVNYARRCKNMMDLMKLKMKLQHSTIDMTAYYLEHFKEESV
jgi:integrase